MGVGDLMAKMSVEGLEEYSLRLSKMGDTSEEMTKKAVWQGAEVVADAIKNGLKGIPIQEGKNGLPPIGTENEKLHGITRRQKADLTDSFGLAPMKEDRGYIQTKAGFDGYGSVKTKKYPKGVPNAVLMRSIESGTSFREKKPVIRTAVNKSRKQAEEEMQKSIDESCKKIFG